MKAHRIVPHSSHTPLNRLRTITFGHHRGAILEGFIGFARSSRTPLISNERLAAAHLVEAWLIGHVDFRRGFTALEAEALIDLLHGFCRHWLGIFGTYAEGMPESLEKSAAWIEEYLEPGEELGKRFALLPEPQPIKGKEVTK